MEEDLEDRLSNASELADGHDAIDAIIMAMMAMMVMVTALLLRLKVIIVSQLYFLLARLLSSSQSMSMKQENNLCCAPVGSL